MELNLKFNAGQEIYFNTGIPDLNNIDYPDNIELNEEQSEALRKEVQECLTDCCIGHGTIVGLEFMNNSIYYRIQTDGGVVSRTEDQITSSFEEIFNKMYDNAMKRYEVVKKAFETFKKSVQDSMFTK